MRKGIRTRLLLSLVSVVFLAVSISMGGSAIRGIQVGRQRTLKELDMVATQKEAEVNTWLYNLHMLMSIFSTKVDENYQNVHVHDDLQVCFQQLVEQTGQFDKVFLLDLQGRVVVSSDPAWEGDVHKNEMYFQEGLKESYTQPLLVSPSQGRMFVAVADPVTDNQGQVIAVLVGYVNLTTLDKIMTG
ncbi:MAG: hypothetical protein GY832_06190, partial [Chloroflexi bacterium]|nr:hypothetical protein [Chloroflexota bacterium]